MPRSRRSPLPPRPDSRAPAKRRRSPSASRPPPRRPRESPKSSRPPSMGRPGRSRDPSPLLRSGLGLPPATPLRRTQWASYRSRSVDRSPSSRARSPSRVSSRTSRSRARPASATPPRPLVPPLALPPLGSANSAHLARWRDRLLDRLPRLDQIPSDYADLRNFLTTIESALGPAPDPQELLTVTLCQITGTVQGFLLGYLRSKYPGEPPSYRRLVRALIDAVAPEDPEKYLRRSLASLSTGKLPLHNLHLHIAACYDTYLDLCTRLRVSPSSTQKTAVSAYLARLPRDIRRDIFLLAGERWPRLQNDLHGMASLVRQRLRIDDDAESPPAAPVLAPALQAPPAAPRDPPKARPRARDLLHNPNLLPLANHSYVNHIQQPTLPQPLGLPPPVPSQIPARVARPAPLAPAAGALAISCFFCRAPGHRLNDCPHYAALKRDDPARARLCPACQSQSFCPADCPRRLSFASSRTRFIELDWEGRSYFVREDRPLPRWYREDLFRGFVGGTPTARVAQLTHAPPPAPSAPSPDRAAASGGDPPLVEPEPEPADDVPHCSPPVPTLPEPAPLSPAAAPPPTVSAPAAPSDSVAPSPSPPGAPPATASCLHARSHRIPPAPFRPTHARALATIDGARCEVIIDTGADISLVSDTLLKPHRTYRPWTAADGRVTGVDNAALSILGRVALEVRLGPLKTMAPFVVVVGPSLPALLGVDFLYAHEISVNLAQHTLIFEGLERQLHPLLGPNPRYVHMCTLARDVRLPPRSRILAPAICPPPPPAAASAAPAASPALLVGPRKDPGVGLFIPEQLSAGMVELCSYSDDPLYLPLGWPLARATWVAPSAVFHARCAPLPPATAAAPPLTSPPLPPAIPADAPTYHKVEGGFLPVLPSTGSCLTPSELAELRTLLALFPDRFNDGSEPLPATTLLQARIPTADVAPLSAPPRRLSPAMREVVRQAVADMDAQGITEPATGPWSVPIVMVRKASGAWRLCCDYREINKHVQVPQQPLPRIDDILASFKGKRYFSVMDLCSGFHQIEIAEEDRPKTSFVTPDCQRQYRRLPFGLASSPAIFQRMIDMLLGGMKWICAVGYIDDIIVYSDTWPDHQRHLRTLFLALRAANLQLHPAKCTFGAAQVKYLGHIISREGIQACASKIQAIVDMPPPNNVKAVQRFLGKCQYYRRYIQNFSALAAPLHRATAKTRDFQWTPECQQAWDKLRQALSSAPLLAHPDYTRKFYVDCDGSVDGLGAVLLQPYEDGERVIAYASRSLVDHEKKWTATELEAAALVWALDTFRPYIDGIRVCVRTDHSPLEYIRSKRSPCRRLERWALRLQEYQFDVIHRPGTHQKHVDCLSRAPLPPAEGQRPMSLDEFPDRAVLAVRAVPPPPVPLRLRPGTSSTSPRLLCERWCRWVQRRAQRAHAAARSLRAHVLTASHLPAPSPDAPSETADDLEVFLTDDEQEEPRAAQPTPSAPLPCPDKASPPSLAPPLGARNIPLPPAVPHDDLAAAQREDEDCRRFSDLLKTPRAEWPRRFAASSLQFTHHAGILCVSTDPDKPPRVLLPKLFREHAIHAHHLSYYGGHFGVQKTAQRLWARYWWPGLRRDVRSFLRKCTFCLATADTPQPWRWLNLPIGTPFELVATDLFGPLRPSAKGNNHILVFIDHHTRWVELVPLSNPTAALVAQAFHDAWISRWGVPRALLSDNGPQFTAELLKQLCTTFGIKKIFAAPYHPRGNSIVEAYMRSLKSTLRLCLHHFRQDWDVALPAAALAYRATPHSVTKCSPFFLVTGQEVVLPLSRTWNEPALAPQGEHWLHALWRCRIAVLRAHQRIETANLKALRDNPHRLLPGMHVALRLTTKERLERGKFSPVFKGPFVVTRVSPCGLSAHIWDPLTGEEHFVNRCRLKFLDLPPPRRDDSPRLPPARFP
ncbi:hypothetical protein ACSSS7_008265 [Eimeria intestinalis]